MVIGQSDEYLCACIFVACNQLVRVPVQQGPLCAKVLVPEPRRRTEVFKLIFVLALVLDIHIARIPVPGFGNALRTPVSPYAELGILVPIRRFVLEQRIPGGFERTIARKIRDGRAQRHIIPKPACNRLRRRVVVPCRRLPCGLIEAFLHNLAIAHLVENSLLRRQGAKLSVVLRVLVESTWQSRLALLVQSAQGMAQLSMPRRSQVVCRNPVCARIPLCLPDAKLRCCVIPVMAMYENDSR